MKQRFTLAILLAVFGFFYGQSQSVPQGFNYQSVVRNAAGTAHANQTVTMLFAIRSGAANGQVIYTERHITNTNEYGLVNLIIGRGEALQGTFDAINWGGGPKYLTASVEVSTNVFEELGSTELLSVPYALYAQNGGGGGGGGNDNWGTQVAATDQSLKGNGTGGNPLGLASQDAQVGQVLKWDGTKWVPSEDISNVGANGGTVTQINTNNGVVGGPISTSGTIGLSNTGVVPGPYGSATQIPVITVDAQGRISNVFTVVPSPGTVNILGGAGIAVQPNGFNFTVTNTGDVNAGDDITTSSTANGDVSGVFSNLQIKNDAVGTPEIANGAITAIKLNAMGATSGQVLKWNGTAWVPSADQSGTINLTGGAGISITGIAPNLTITNSGDPNPADDITTATQAAGDVTGPFSNLQIAAGVVNTAELANNAVTTPKIADDAVTTAKIADGAITTPLLAAQAVTAAKLDDMGATSGQILKWNGTAWAPAADQTGALNLTSGNGISITGTAPNLTITNSGDPNPADDITTTTGAGGDVTGTFDDLQLSPGVVSSTELAANAVTTPKIADNAVTTPKIANAAVTTAKVADGAITTPKVADGAITAAKLDDMGATNGQVLTWNNTSMTWVPTTPTGGTINLTSGTGITITGTAPNLTIANSGDTNAADDITTATLAGGDVTGTFNNLQIVANAVNTAELANGAVTGAKIDDMGATPGQVLTWSQTSNSWIPATPASGGAGDNWGSQTVLTNATLAGSGTAGSPLALAKQGATAGQILKWSDMTNNWIPANDLVGAGGNTYAAGTAISITGTAPNFTINNTGDASNTNEIQTLSLTGNILSLSNSGGSVTLPAAVGNTYTAGAGINITGVAPSQTIVNTGDLSTSNELQTIALAGNTITLSQGGGSVVVDPSTTNELQSLSISGNTLTLSQGGGNVTLPGGNTYSAGTAISITGTAPNLTINNTGDPSSTNELQNLSLNGTTLKISGTNSTVKLDTVLGSAGLNLWKATTTGGHIYNNNTGNVGVGTLLPEAKLHIKGNGRSVHLEGSDPIISFAGTPTAVEAYAGLRNSSLTLGTRDSSDIVLQTAQDGKGLTQNGLTSNVGIGGANTGIQKLKVIHEDGGFMLENGGSGINWEFLVSDQGSLALYNSFSLGGVPAGVFAPNGTYTPSDRRLKKDINAIPSVLSKLSYLHPVTYHYNNEAATAPVSMGLIAQDVQSVFPELVGVSPIRNGEGGTLMVNYGGMSVVAIKAVQEQQEQIERLKNENAQLRSRLDAIEALLNIKK